MLSVSTFDLITLAAAASNSLVAFCFCNLIIAILLVGSSKPSSNITVRDQQNPTAPPGTADKRDQGIPDDSFSSCRSLNVIGEPKHVSVPAESSSVEEAVVNEDGEEGPDGDGDDQDEEDDEPHWETQRILLSYSSCNCSQTSRNLQDTFGKKFPNDFGRRKSW